MEHNQTRREFLAGAAATGTAARISSAPKPVERRSILNFNENMEYRRLGKTGLMVSAIGMGGHWKRVEVMLRDRAHQEGVAHDLMSLKNPEFIKNRHDIVSRSIEAGINYLDACSGGEVMAYSRVLKGRRDKMYLGYSWYEKESRKPEWCSEGRLIQGLDEGLREAGLEYVDLWRISLPIRQLTSRGELLTIEEGAMKALERAKKQGKTRFTAVSAHNREWLKSLVERYSQQIDVVLFPYTAHTKELPQDSIFEAVKKHDIGVFGIKPFADNSLFAGDSSPSSPHAADDDRRARLALRYILSNPAITAPIPGLISFHQVENAVRSVQERRQLDRKEKAELEDAGRAMWTRLSPTHRWLREWEHV